MAAHPLLNAVYAIKKMAWRALRPRTRGVKVMLFNARDEIILVRHSYGRSDLFVLPGGGVRPFEAPADAATREMREELGLAVSALKPRSQHVSASEGKRDTITLFEGRVDGAPRLRGIELDEARFVPLDTLPPATSPATRRRIEEYLGKRELDGRW